MLVFYNAILQINTKLNCFNKHCFFCFRFHGIYWPAFLMAAGLEPPHQLLVHSHWTVNSEKMSKSRGNVVLPPSPTRGNSFQELLAMRYFLLRTGTPHKDNSASCFKLLLFDLSMLVLKL